MNFTTVKRTEIGKVSSLIGKASQKAIFCFEAFYFLVEMTGVCGELRTVASIVIFRRRTGLRKLLRVSSIHTYISLYYVVNYDVKIL